MTGDELKVARITLGFLWGYNGLISAAELGRALGDASRDPGRTIVGYESGKWPIPPYFAVLIKLLLAGAPIPPDTDLRKNKKVTTMDQNLEALKAEFRLDYFRYLVDDGKKEGYEVDFDTEFETWLANRASEQASK